MKFPEFVKNSRYCYDCLKPILDFEWEKSFQEFKIIFNEISDLNLVHFE